VPQDDVLAVDVAVGGDVGRQPGASRMLVGQVAGGVALGRVVAGDPQVPGGEGGPAGDGRAGVGGQQGRLLRVERVGDRLAGVDHVPGPADRGVGGAGAVGLAGQSRHPAGEGVAVGVVRPHRHPLQLHLVDGVVDAVDRHVSRALNMCW
jgi:hypothetical protein